MVRFLWKYPQGFKEINKKIQASDSVFEKMAIECCESLSPTKKIYGRTEGMQINFAIAVIILWELNQTKKNTGKFLTA